MVTTSGQPEGRNKETKGYQTKSRVTSTCGIGFRSLSEKDKESYRKRGREYISEKRKDPEYRKKDLASKIEYKKQRTFEESQEDEMLPEDFKDLSNEAKKQKLKYRSKLFEHEYERRKKLEEENPRYKKYIQKIREE